MDLLNISPVLVQIRTQTSSIEKTCILHDKALRIWIKVLTSWYVGNLPVNLYTTNMLGWRSSCACGLVNLASDNRFDKKNMVSDNLLAMRDMVNDNMFSMANFLFMK